MMSHLEYMARSFAVLESLPQHTAFGIVSQLAHLRQSPRMGATLGPRFPKLKDFRQILYKRVMRVIYEFDEYENVVYILAIQDCRQKLPSARHLKRDNPNGT